jgi:hypothetical protein
MPWISAWSVVPRNNPTTKKHCSRANWYFGKTRYFWVFFILQAHPQRDHDERVEVQKSSTSSRSSKRQRQSEGKTVMGGAAASGRDLPFEADTSSSPRA